VVVAEASELAEAPSVVEVVVAVVSVAAGVVTVSVAAGASVASPPEQASSVAKITVIILSPFCFLNRSNDKFRCAG
jgi:hypothetical protein